MHRIQDLAQAEILKKMQDAIAQDNTIPQAEKSTLTQALERWAKRN
jgi:hypothetical protein